MKIQEDEYGPKKEKQLLEFLENKLKTISDFSYIKLAKKAFLEKEKSILTKIPQYIEIKKSSGPIDLPILDKLLLKAGTIEIFINEVKKHYKAKTYVIEFCEENHPKKKIWKKCSFFMLKKVLLVIHYKKEIKMFHQLGNV